MNTNRSLFGAPERYIRLQTTADGPHVPPAEHASFLKVLAKSGYEFTKNELRNLRNPVQMKKYKKTNTCTYNPPAAIPLAVTHG